MSGQIQSIFFWQQKDFENFMMADSIKEAEIRDGENEGATEVGVHKQLMLSKL